MTGCAPVVDRKAVVSGERGRPFGLGDDEACRAVARDIERSRPGWMVVWGVYSKRFTAYPLFAVRRRAIVVALYPEALVERMDSAERLLRIRPGAGYMSQEKEGGSSGG